jgi:hypothetical protein
VADWVAYALMAGALVAAAWSGVLLALDRSLNDALFWLLAVVELGLVAEVVAGSIALAMTDREVDGVTFVGYLATVWLVLPLGVAWAASEKTRWGTGVLLLSCITVTVMVLRLQQTWNGL